MMMIKKDFAPQFMSKETERSSSADLPITIIGVAAYLTSAYLFASAILGIPLW